MNSAGNQELCDELSNAEWADIIWAHQPVKALGEAGCENTVCESQVDLKCEIVL